MQDQIRPGLGDRLRPALRAWLQATAPRSWRAEMAGASETEWKEFNDSCFSLLRGIGLAVPHWPEEYGGGFTFAEQLIIKEEMRRADFPLPRFHMISLGHAAATLLQHGTPDQKQLLKGILDGEIWCQGFSEPEAGSDLASLRTTAVFATDHYVVNGQKIWSSVAQHASWCLLLARTDPSADKHAGLSVFAMDMRSAGITVRPIRQATGTREFCEIFLDNVCIPASQLVGPENEGWKVAQTTLATERSSQAVELHAELSQALSRIVGQMTSTVGDSGRLVIEEAAFRSELASCISRVDALGWMAQQLAIDVTRGDALAGPEASIMKLFYSETLQKVTGLAARVGGLPALHDPCRQVDVSWTSGDWFIDHLKSWTWTIAAGSNEIQRNIIGERVLGLPR